MNVAPRSVSLHYTKLVNNSHDWHKHAHARKQQRTRLALRNGLLPQEHCSSVDHQGCSGCRTSLRARVQACHRGTRLSSRGPRALVHRYTQVDLSMSLRRCVPAKVELLMSLRRFVPARVVPWVVLGLVVVAKAGPGVLPLWCLWMSVLEDQALKQAVAIKPCSSHSEQPGTLQLSLWACVPPIWCAVHESQCIEHAAGSG